ncbi:Vitamin H transporter-like protein [Emericellopsis cladophorae]|uniref:Vitamin H transporter-like protein n=1 Tax=Emericellopsis cladophorae TaxID=2686198 RepID=A0A9Q0BGL2_9HYPO|nr:Vitamin H transporter-like protein [Emericellopsis cladophorae]KAI6784101.1 Vitamin H transporter-like protein [Emericellopsis cladophorae]
MAYAPDKPAGVDSAADNVTAYPLDAERAQQAVDDYDVATVERVYRKLDLRIIPAFWVLYFLCSAIRSNIGIAQTMNQDAGHDLMTVLNLTPRDTSLALALFYVAYVIFDFPSNLVMSKLSPRVWMARIVFATGVVGACFAAVQDAWSLKLLRFLLGVVIAGMWPGMSYYLTLFYPPSRTGKRIGMYFTAAQVSAAVVGLVSAGFQLMDGLGGLVGFRWMFLIYGLVAIVLSFILLWWLPDRPLPPGQVRERKGLWKFLPPSPEALTGQDAVVHYQDLKRVYHARPWGIKDLGRTLLDWRLWPLTLMYFGVVGVGIGTQLYGSVIIRSIQPTASGIEISLLFAPIWIMDLIAILIFMPISDRFHRYRAFIFSGAVCVQITGLLIVAFATNNGWARYGGLLMVGFGLGPTVPNCMAWTNEIFQRRHGEVGVATASALVSGLGNLGSVTSTYALYTGWPEDAAPGPYQYRRSNFTMIGILVMSIASSFAMMILLRIFGNEPSTKLHDAEIDSELEDGAARRENQQRGFGLSK